MAKNTDTNGFEVFEGGHGKKANQKLKPYLVLQYLMKYSDENNVISAPDLVGYLQETCGIYAERRSIYRDIEEINKALLIIENEIDVHEAEEILAEDTEDNEKTIIYDKSKKGFYVKQRHYDLHDIRLLAECVYSAKFLAEGQAKRLANVVCEFVSEEQAKQITHDAFLTDRVKTNNKSVINNIAEINEAMSAELEGEKHIPEKISFKYLKYSINDLSQQVERRHGAKYVVSPFALLINDGNYYLLAYSDAAQDLRTYRVDRMKDVQLTGEPREGEKAFAAVDLKTYTQRVFSMFGGTQERVTMRFVNPLLDTVVDRFGTKGVQYAKVDDFHFCLTASVEISDQFYGWILGFGNKVKITMPERVVNGFTEYLDKIRNLYE
jgi:predicted DNA-binding transcriptional regulator YafY